MLLKPLLWFSISECHADKNERIIKSENDGGESQPKPSYMNQYISMFILVSRPFRINLNFTFNTCIWI